MFSTLFFIPWFLELEAYISIGTMSSAKSKIRCSIDLVTFYNSLYTPTWIRGSFKRNNCKIYLNFNKYLTIEILQTIIIFGIFVETYQARLKWIHYHLFIELFELSQCEHFGYFWGKGIKFSGIHKLCVFIILKQLFQPIQAFAEISTAAINHILTVLSFPLLSHLRLFLLKLFDEVGEVF